MLKQIVSRFIRHKRFYSFWMYLNRLSHYGLNYGVASAYADYSGELHTIKKLKKHKGQMVVFDIGANVGDWSKFVISEYHNIDYQLHMFEPAISTFKQLKTNIKNSDNHVFHNLALGDVRKTSTLFYDHETQGCASIVIKNADLSEQIDIKTLDEFCEEKHINNIDFLKMDVQGYEYNILLGAENMLAKGKIQYIQFEFDAPNIEQRLFFKDFWELLHDSFDIYKCLYDGLVKINEYSYELENFRCLNYLAVKK